MEQSKLSKYLIIFALGLPIAFTSKIVLNIFKAIFSDLIPNTEFSKLFEPLLASKLLFGLILGIVTLSIGYVMADHLEDIKEINARLSKSKLPFFSILIPNITILGGLLLLSQNANNGIILGFIVLITVFLRGVVRAFTLIQNDQNKEYTALIKLIFEVFFRALEYSEIVALTLFFVLFGWIAWKLGYYNIAMSSFIFSIGGFIFNIFPENWLLAPHKLQSFIKNRRSKSQKQKNKLNKGANT